MATSRQLLALLLLASLAHAATLEEFITPYFYPGENYSADVSPAQFDVGGAHYVMVNIRGQDAFLLNRSVGTGNVTDYSFVNDTESLFQILRQCNANATIPPQSRIDGILALIDKFQASRNPKESDCKHFTGVGRGLPCTLQRCDACMRVPICAQVMPYWGDDFIQSIIYFESNLSVLDRSIANARSNLSLAANESYDSSTLLENAAAELGSAGIHAQAILSDHLFGCDERLTWCYAPRRDPATIVCIPPPYNLTALSMAQANATSLKARVITNSTLRTQAQAISLATAARDTARILREENATFSVFLSAIQRKETNVASEANVLLLHISDESLRADVGVLGELVLNISQFGLDRNFTAANETTAQFHALAAKIDAETRSLNQSYYELLAADDSATLALFRAQLVLEPQDYALGNELQQYEVQTGALDQVLLGQIAPDDIDDARADLRYLAARADAITASKRGQRVQQIGVWLGTAARIVSGYVIGGISLIIPLSPEAKEGYARTLPSLVITLFAAFLYLGSLAVFAFAAFTRRIQLHRVALILWAIIFLFLFVLVGIATITAHSLVQQQASRSTFDLFSESVRGSPATAVVVSDGNAGGASLSAARSCAELLGRNLTALGKSVTFFDAANSTCTRNGTVLGLSECASGFGDYPVFKLSPGNSTSTTFYVYYAKEASLRGNETFYSRCLISRVFG